MGPPPARGAAPARYSNHFDPWNSSSTGHQRAENQPGTGWRESRARKLNSQFSAGRSGGVRLSDTYGANSELWDESLKSIVPKSVRTRQGNSVFELLAKPGNMKEKLTKGAHPREKYLEIDGLPAEETLTEKRREEDEGNHQQGQHSAKAIFDGVVVYVNGSTYPLVSDHRLKQILRDNGAQMSIHLGRRKVTHVIIGRPAGTGRGAGGGLAGGKLEKEIRTISGCGVKFVGVEWVLESLEAGKRLPEARFASLKVAAKGQGSVYNKFSKVTGSDRKNEMGASTETKGKQETCQ